MKKSDDVLSKITDDDLTEYLTMCSKTKKINIDIMHTLTKDIMKSFKNKKVTGLSIDPFTNLQQRWYQSLEKGNPDFSVYSHRVYFSELWLCWKNYSRPYLVQLKKNLEIIKTDKPIKRIVDLGCGSGYTTAALKQIFPKAEVIGTNLKGTAQYKMAKKLGKIFDFKVQEDLCEADLIFASEYFEHIEEPIKHLEDVLEQCQPRILLIANSFTVDAIGHFNEYILGGSNAKMYGKKINFIFNARLRHHKYIKVETKWWNNRPALWEKISNTTNSIIDNKNSNDGFFNL